MARAANKKAAKKTVQRKAAKPAARKKLSAARTPPSRKAANTPRKSPSNGAVAGNKQRFTLHGVMTSGPTYTAALMLSLCRHPYSYIHVNLREGQHKQPDYLVKNRYGQVPTLRDGQMFLVQSSAIIEYLAETLKKLEGKTIVEKQRIREWLFWQWDKLALPVFRLRARNRGLRQFGDEVRVMYDTEAKAALAVLEHELLRSDWIAAKRPTAADVGIYGVLRYAPEASIDLSPYPHVVAWKKRFEALPGFGTPEQLLPMESRLL
ncbi:MAG: glutathione S-transferase family protein [Aestuariivirga sp.]